MENLLLKTEEDFEKYKKKSSNTDQFYNSPEEYPCLMVNDYYKVRHESGELGRFGKFIYRRDVLELFVPLGHTLQFPNGEAANINELKEGKFLGESGYSACIESIYNGLGIPKELLNDSSNTT